MPCDSIPHVVHREGSKCDHEQMRANSDRHETFRTEVNRNEATPTESNPTGDESEVVAGHGMVYHGAATNSQDATETLT